MPLTTERVIQVYGCGARYYDGVMATVYAALINRKEVMDLFAPVAGECLLEIGIGTGLNLPLYPPGVELTGTDLVPEMLEGSEQRRGDFQGDSLDLRVADTANLPFSDASFDGVLGTLTLCASPHPDQALAEMARVCRPGGRIVVFEAALSPNPGVAMMQQTLLHPTTTSVGFPPPTSEYPDGVIIWDSCRDYVQIGQQIGLADPEVTWFDAEHPVLCRCLIRWQR